MSRCGAAAGDDKLAALSLAVTLLILGHTFPGSRTSPGMAREFI